MQRPYLCIRYKKRDCLFPFSSESEQPSFLQLRHLKPLDSTTMIAAKYISLLALPILAVATPTTNNSPSTTVSVTSTSTATQPASQCDTGSIQCCDSVQSSSSESAAGLLGLLGVVLQGLNVPVGLTCSPVSVVGVGGNSW